METDRNFLLLDRFRQVARLMRMGWTPDDIPTVKEKMIRTSTASSGDSCVRLFKREMILGVLMLSEDGMNQREIAEEMGVSPSTLSEMINRLVEDGYVERKADPGDRRARLLSLTEAGRIQGQEILEECACVLAFLFRNLEDGDKMELVRLLDKLLGRTEEQGT
jgi:DNA-binding MarR family transcriptional regulator